MVGIRKVLRAVQGWHRRRTIREGRNLSRFIATDVRRDIVVMSTARIEEGLITCRMRTTNLLYVARGLAVESEFEPPKEVRVDDMWKWTGQPWGGLPDGTSIVDHVPRERPD